MFQYAAGRTLAARHETHLALERSWIDQPSPLEPRRFDLGCFEVDVPLKRIGELARVSTASRRPRLRALASWRLPAVTVLEENRSQDRVPGFHAATDNTYLRGFWQRVGYFQEAEPLLRQDFVFRNRPSATTEALAERVLAAPQTASIHVRRQDYTITFNRARLGLLAPGYFERAIALIAERVGPLHLFVISDDPDWCRAQLRFHHETTIVGANPPERAWEELYLMSLCNHHVIANSTFGWWGAWLDPRPDKLVVAPRPWFVDPRFTHDEDRTPEDWIRIDRGAPDES